MALQRTQQTWNRLGAADPLWAILTYDEKNERRWDEDEFFATGETEMAELFDYLEQIDVDFSRGRALDFGCGVGRLTQPLAGRFDQVFGVDIAASMLSRARAFNRYPERCSYVLNEHGDLRQFGSCTFQFINSCITLQHVHRRYVRRYIAEFMRLLDHGGVAVFQLPDDPVGPLIQRLRYMLKCWLPDPAVRAAQSLAGRLGDMEMFGLRIDEVRRIVESGGGSILQLRLDRGRDLQGGNQGYPRLESSMHSSGWVSLQYVVRKG